MVEIGLIKDTNDTCSLLLHIMKQFADIHLVKYITYVIATYVTYVLYSSNYIFIPIE